MLNIQSSGPVRVYVSFDPPTFSLTSLTGFRQLGTCEITPSITEIRNYKAVENPIAGSEIPLDQTMEGIAAKVEVLLTYYDALLLKQLTAYTSTVNNSLGQYSAFKDVGNTIYGKKTIQLVLKNTFFGTANDPVQIEPGYLFYASTYAGSVTTPGGTSANKIGLVFNCYPVYVPLTQSLGPSQSSGNFRLYDTPSIIKTLPD